MSMRFASFVFFCVTLPAQDRTLDKISVLGKQLADEVARTTAPVESQEVQDYVARLGARLTAQLPNPALAYTFSTVSSNRTNALHEPLAIPGGYIFVPSSLLLTANDEAEFAGMLAQAIARASPSFIAKSIQDASPERQFPLLSLIVFSTAPRCPLPGRVSATRNGAASGRNRPAR